MTHKILLSTPGSLICMLVSIISQAQSPDPAASSPGWQVSSMPLYQQRPKHQRQKTNSDLKEIGSNLLQWKEHAKRYFDVDFDTATKRMWPLSHNSEPMRLRPAASNQIHPRGMQTQRDLTDFKL